MTLKIVFIVLFIFLAGFLTSQVLFTSVNMAEAVEQNSPSDWIQQDQIKVYDDHIFIDVAGAEWATFADTNSMDPFLDKGANALQLIPESEDQIHPGDIISFRTSELEDRIIHRVIFKGEDEKGVYFITKGDNNPISDPGKVRFDQIDRVLFAIIY